MNPSGFGIFEEVGRKILGAEKSRVSIKRKLDICQLF